MEGLPLFPEAATDSAAWATLLTGPFATALIDPPWNFKTWSATGRDRCADRHCRVPLLEVLKAIPVANIMLPDSVIIVWSTCCPGLSVGAAAASLRRGVARRPLGVLLQIDQAVLASFVIAESRMAAINLALQQQEQLLDVSEHKTAMIAALHKILYVIVEARAAGDRAAQARGGEAEGRTRTS
jgi:hypothetical protein